MMFEEENVWAKIELNSEMTCKSRVGLFTSCGRVRRKLRRKNDLSWHVFVGGIHDYDAETFIDE
jgi:hypothetical protein